MPIPQVLPQTDYEMTLPEQPVGQGVACVDLMTEGSHGLFMRIYYPTQAHDQRIQYIPMHDDFQTELMPDRNGYVRGFLEFMKMDTPVFGHYNVWVSGKQLVEASRLMQMAWQAPHKPSDSRADVIIFSPGYGGNRWCNAGLSAALVAAGFVVVVIEHGDGTSCWTYRQNGAVLMNYPGRRVMKAATNRDFFAPHIDNRSDEVIKTCEIIRQLSEGKLDMSSVVVGNNFDFNANFGNKLNVNNLTVMGHSFGGPTSLATIEKCPDVCKRLVMLDPFLPYLNKSQVERLVPLNKPILTLAADSTAFDADRKLQMTKTSDHWKMCMIKGSTHITWCDMGRVSNHWYMIMTPKVDCVLADQITADAIKAFILDEAVWPPKELLTKHSDWLKVPATENVLKKLNKTNFEFTDAV